MRVLSQALRSKLVCKLAINEEREWVKFCTTKYLQKNHIIRIAKPPYGSPCWNGLMDVRYVVISTTVWNVRYGEYSFFWEDSWIRERSLISFN